MWCGYQMERRLGALDEWLKYCGLTVPWELFPYSHGGAANDTSYFVFAYRGFNHRNVLTATNQLAMSVSRSIYGMECSEFSLTTGWRQTVTAMGAVKDASYFCLHFKNLIIATYLLLKIN